MAVEPTIALHRRARFEQKELECSAKDGESPVCQESQPFIFVPMYLTDVRYGN